MMNIWSGASDPTHDVGSVTRKRAVSEKMYADEQITPHHSLSADDFVNINVCGMLYETLHTTLQRFPHTLLGDVEKRRPYYRSSKNAYYFDRNRECFEIILNYYQSGGNLVRPSNIPFKLFLQEVSFFGLGETIVDELVSKEGFLSSNEIGDTNTSEQSPWQRKIWKLFEYPDSSVGARLLALWSLCVIALSIVVFCVETMPVFKQQIHERHMRTMKTLNTTYHQNPNHFTSNEQPWFSLELACILWFTIEYLIRLLASPCKSMFVCSLLNIIDLMAIVPYFLILAINSGDDTTPLSVLRVVRLARIFRVFKLSRHSMGLQILAHTFKASLSELGMLVFFLFIGVILFSTAVFYAENVDNNIGSSNYTNYTARSNTFTSIPDTFWYCIVTMTTVGYGDKVPVTSVGKLIGTMCAVVGVLAIAMPVPVIVANFSYFYKQNQELVTRRHLNKRKRQKEVSGNEQFNPERD